MKEDLLQTLKKIPNVEIESGKDLTTLTTMRLTSRGDLITVRSLEALQATLKMLNAFQVPYAPLGLGANTLLPEVVPHPLIKLQLPFDSAELENFKEEYTLPASVSLGHLTQCALRFGLKGWEVFTGIPATLGGALFMNAGTNLGEIGPLVTKISLVNAQGQIETLIPDAHFFSYRKNNFLKKGDVIFEVTLKHLGQDPQIPELIQGYLKKRAASQPLGKRTCGCVFKNRKEAPACRAGQSLDILGLKGFTFKALQVSTVHANFFEHRGGSTRSDLLEMTDIINDELRLQMGISLELEART